MAGFAVGCCLYWSSTFCLSSNSEMKVSCHCFGHPFYSICRSSATACDTAHHWPTSLVSQWLTAQHVHLALLHVAAELYLAAVEMRHVLSPAGEQGRCLAVTCALIASCLSAGWSSCHSQCRCLPKIWQYGATKKLPFSSLEVLCLTYCGPDSVAVCARGHDCRMSFCLCS